MPRDATLTGLTNVRNCWESQSSESSDGVSSNMLLEIGHTSIQLQVNECLPASPDIIFPLFSLLESFSCTLPRQLHSSGKATVSLAEKIVVITKSLIWFSFFSSNMCQTLTEWGICVKSLVKICNFSILNRILHNDNGYTMNTKCIHFNPFNSCFLQFFSLNFLVWWNSCANCRKIPVRLNTIKCEFKPY